MRGEIVEIGERGEIDAMGSMGGVSGVAGVLLRSIKLTSWDRLSQYEGEGASQVMSKSSCPVVGVCGEEVEAFGVGPVGPAT